MDADSPGPRETAVPSLRARVLVFLLVSAFAFPAVLGLGMTRGLSHDEHQHVAAGALIARDGLLPYRDFPHFHTPYLAFAYALLFRVSDHLLIAARLLSVLSATAILGIIGSIAYHLFRNRGKRFALLVCAGSVLLALTTTLFTETSGHAWNHEPSLFLALLAFVSHLAGLRSARLGWFAASGALLGLAIGTRITCAPLVAPFGLALLLYPTFGWRWNRVLGFAGGMLLGLAGLFYFFAVMPEQAWFGNFAFAKVNIIYRLSTGEPRTMTILKKLRFFFKVIIRPDTALFVAGLAPVLAAWLANRRTERRLPPEVRFILLLLPFVLMGSFAPSPLFDQYFYPLVPFLLLAGLYALASIPSPWFRRTLLIGAAAVVLSVGMGVRAYDDFRDFFVTKDWHGMELHERAQEIRSHVSRGRVLTLAPIYPLEAGLSIDPAFSTGSFAWRISPYLELEKATRLGIVSPATLESALNAAPPEGMLVGFEKNGEGPLSEYASRHGYERRPLADGKQLWVRRRD
ncbi:MAG: hypothetical protein QOE70_1660 [Chthoniobacter sp.]|jgi:MFS family permease|nr:hypothetical protein [Chthoniobacter sp.]